MPSISLFQPVSSTDPAAAILEQVRTKVQRGELVSGDKLPAEREFAERLGVSRNTVRRAIGALSQLGLVTVRKGTNGGAFIAEQGGNAIRTAMTDMFHLGSIASAELTEARLVLSQSVVRLACHRCTEEDIQALADNVQAAEVAVARDDVGARITLNIDFYRLLAKAARNQVLVLLMDAVGEAIKQFVRSAGLLAPEAVMPVRHKIIAALRRRDEEAAVATLVEHLAQLEEHYRHATPGRAAAHTAGASVPPSARSPRPGA